MREAPETHAAIPRTALLVVTEAHYDLNAGFVASIADPEAPSPLDTSQDPNVLTELFLAARTAFMSASVAPTNPTKVARGGLLYSGLVGSQINCSLDAVFVWELMGEFAVNRYWPLEEGWTPGQSWSRKASHQNLTTWAQTREPHFGRWARGTFEQGSLSALSSLANRANVVVLPGDGMFQANHCPPDRVRPAIYHS